MTDEAYLPTHEWARRDGDSVLIGLSRFAVGEVGDVIHVQLPTVGARVSRGQACAEIESVKSVNDVYSPVDGTVLSVNSDLQAHPERINADPLAAWFARIAPSGPAPLEGLLSSADYQARLAGGA
jgi:glycine cleavage system H protein